MSEEKLVGLTSGGTVVCSAEYANELESFTKLFAAHHQPMAEAERFGKFGNRYCKTEGN